MNTNDLSRIAGLVGEPARTRMLVELLDGRALTAGELARVAGIAAATASRHLSLLVEGGLIVVAAQGRHRYHRLASAEVGAVLEGLMQLASLDQEETKAETEGKAETDGGGPASRAAASPPRRQPGSIVTGPRDRRLRLARTCYDHLAGRIGVAITEHLVETGAVELDPVAARVTATLPVELARLDLVLPPGVSASACRPCMDWAERRPHLSGPLATRLCRHVIERGWLRRPRAGRGLEVTGDGARCLGGWLGARRWAFVIDEA